MQRVIIFDFDGTIADTLHALIETYNSVAPTYRCKQVELKEIEALRQGHFMRKLMTDYGITSWKLPFVFRAIRKGLQSKMKDAKPFEGMPEVLKKLKAEGFELGIISSNAKENIEIFLRAQGLEDIFSFVVFHRNLFGKHVAFNRFLKERKMLPGDLTYIGDEERDIVAAKRSGLKNIAVTWGYQSHSILKLSNPDQIVDKPEELLSIFS